MALEALSLLRLVRDVSLGEMKLAEDVFLPLPSHVSQNKAPPWRTWWGSSEISASGN